MQRLFVYGTLAPGRSNAHQLERIDGTWEAATVRGTLHPDGWGAAMGYPALVPNTEGDVVAGFVFASDELDEHWDRLDAFEGEAYERVEIAVTLEDGSAVDAFLYALRDR